MGARQNQLKHPATDTAGLHSRVAKKHQGVAAYGDKREECVGRRRKKKQKKKTGVNQDERNEKKNCFPIRRAKKKKSNDQRASKRTGKTIHKNEYKHC